jgi:hypothetical protein
LDPPYIASYNADSRENIGGIGKTSVVSRNRIV